jgi:hypothetical protein
MRSGGDRCGRPNAPTHRGTEMSDDDLKAELERLRNENAALKKAQSGTTRIKVSDKGGVSVYGLGRFPVTLYKEQWLKLLNMADEIRSFIAANEPQLKSKE